MVNTYAKSKDAVIFAAYYATKMNSLSLISKKKLSVHCSIFAQTRI